MRLLTCTFLLVYRSRYNSSIWNSHLAKHKRTVCSQIQNRKLRINSVDRENLNIIHGKWKFSWGLWPMCFMYVCLEWPHQLSLSASADEKWASCLQNSLPCDPFALGSHTAGKVCQVHLLPFLMRWSGYLCVTQAVFMACINVQLFISWWLWPLLLVPCLADRDAVISVQISFQFIVHWSMLRIRRVRDGHRVCL